MRDVGGSVRREASAFFYSSLPSPSPITSLSRLSSLSLPAPCFQVYQLWPMSPTNAKLLPPGLALSSLIWSHCGPPNNTRSTCPVSASAHFALFPCFHQSKRLTFWWHLALPSSAAGCVLQLMALTASFFSLHLISSSRSVRTNHKAPLLLQDLPSDDRTCGWSSVPS